MANSGVAQRQSSQPNNAYHCKECSMYFDSMKSLDVHLHYHKENLLSKWASQASFAEESNNNNGSHHKNGNAKHNGKGNAAAPIAAPADSSDASVAMKKCPVMPQARAPYGRPASPGAQFGYGVGTPAYQPVVPDAQRFSPANGHQMFGYPNGNRATPPGFQPYNQSYNSLRPVDAQPQNNAFYDGNLQQYAPTNPQDVFANAATTTASSVVPSAFRYHPYQHANGYPGGERVVSSSSYGGGNGVPTARPTSPQQCDKCGAICDTSASLADHLAVAHPPTPVGQFAPAPASRHNGFHPASHHVKQEPFEFAGDLDGRIKQETEDPPNEILDLDSHKVHVYQPPEEEEERNGGNGGGNPHSVSAMLWGGGGGAQQPPPDDGKMYGGGGGHSPGDRKHFVQQRGPTPDYVTSTLTSPPSAPHLVPHGYHQNAAPPPPRYQTLDHRPQPMQAITSSQVPSLAPSLASPPPAAAPTPTPATAAATGGKGNSWKSNEARRPKTYNCSACNKWFTSSGHLKRHYNTTLHKNAVKQSGAPDPATLPIQSHHHPDRDPNYVPRGRRGAAQEDVDARASPVSSLGNEDSSRSDEYSRSTPQQQQQHAQPQHAQLSGLMQNGGLVTQHPPQQQHPQQRPSEYELHPQHLPPPGYAMEHRPPPMMHHHLGHHRSPSPGRLLGGPDMMAPTADMMHADAMMRRLTPPHPVALLTSAQMEQQMMQPYPNALPPHVTSSNSSSIVSLLPPSTTTLHTINSSQITSTGSPASSSASSASPPVDEAALARHQMEEMLHHQQQQQQQSAQVAQPQFYGNVFSPLPSFAQFGQQFGQPTPMTLMQQHGMNGLMAPGSGYLVAPSTAENVGGLLPSPSSQYLLMETYQGVHHQHMQQQQQQQQQLTQLTQLTPMSIPQHEEYVTGDLPATSLSGDRFNNSDSNASLGENILSPVGTPDCPTSTRSEYDLMIDMKQDDEARLKEDILTVSSTNEINIYSSNSISNGTLHKCIDCDKVFNKACYLTQHNKSFHSGLKPFKCHRCGKRFPSEFLYEEHLTKHAGDKPYKCEICPKQFNHKTDLRRHLCLHTGEKPYSCEICGKGFIRKDHMLKHCITHRRKLLNQPSHITA